MASRDIILEIGTEEIPARFLPGEMDSIREIAAKALADSAITHGAITSYATPRRLALIIDGVTEMQADRVREVFGPPKNAAYAPDGSLTKAALGFAKGQNVSPEQLVIKPKGKGEYVAVVIEEKGRPVAELLPDILRGIVLSMSFPKSMRWGDGTVRYARPIHWILALFGPDPVRFEVEGIISGNITRGHRFLAPSEFPVTNVTEYVEGLSKACVVVDRDKRMKYIAEQAKTLAGSVGGEPVYSDELLSIVACILEYPVAVLGGFSKDYLSLPDELLTAVMVGHQKYFPVKGPDGKLLNNFIIVSNTRIDNADNVRAGAERVIRARFDDAGFYYREDRARKLEDRVKDLANVTFQERLGSTADKVERVKKLAASYADLICPDQKAECVRAAELCKSDLITGVVREFPELQGLMGMYYARLDGESEAVAAAIREQYLPAFSGDRVPATGPGAVVSLADRMDNLVSFFSIDLRPTGSEDPFALRRQSLGVISILLERGYEFTIRDLMARAMGGHGAIEQDLSAFFEQRIEPLLTSRGYAYDLVQSVLPYALTMPVKDIFGRLDALKALKESHASYNQFLAAIKRVRNIIPADQKLPELKDTLFKADAERALHGVFVGVVNDLKSCVARRDYAGAIEAMMKLNAPVNKFFDDVLVMDKDTAVRDNRLAFMKDIWDAVSSIADFSRLSERQQA